MDKTHALLLFIFTCLLNVSQGALAIGINYGLLGDNLPPPTTVISQLKQNNISTIRLFEPRPDVLTALQASNVSIILGTRNEDLQQLASDPSVATKWVKTNVVPHHPSVNIKCISAGNEVTLGNLAQYVPDAMKNLDSALKAANIASVQVSTTVPMSVMLRSSPPSQGAFSPAMTPVVDFLASKKSLLLVNVYPYFARIEDPTNVELTTALFQDNATSFCDGQLVYRNIFDAMVDAVYAALEKAGGSGVEIVVTETGWPSDGGKDASIENAKIYVNNLIQHVSSGRGTPRKPGKDVETYIFAMFNEDLKPVGVEQHWGLFYPNLTQVYRVNLRGKKHFVLPG